MAPKIEKIIDNDGILLGEGPHWDAETQSLYFIDAFGHYIHKYTPSTKKHTKASIGKHVSFIIPIHGKNDEFIIASERALVRIKWDGESENVSVVEKVYEVDTNTENHLNDGKCDATGRLWSGTLGPRVVESTQIDPVGSLYNFQNGKVSKQLPNIYISNGLAFDTDAKKFYYVDSYKGTVDQYDLDLKNGKISNEKTVFKLQEPGFKDKVLDGMTIDTDGNLWVAVFNDHKVLKIDPRKPGTIADTIELPAKQVTSVNFGGPNLDELYVTTGNFPIFGETPTSPADGAVYRVTGLNAKGYPGVRVVL